MIIVMITTQLSPQAASVESGPSFLGNVGIFFGVRFDTILSSLFGLSLGRVLWQVWDGSHVDADRRYGADWSDLAPRPRATYSETRTR